MFRLRVQNEEFDLNWLMRNMLSLTEVDDFLRIFGKWIYRARIKSIPINDVKRCVQSLSKIVLGSAAKHCPNLISLKFTDFTLFEELVREFLPLFMRLKELEVIASAGPLPFQDIIFPGITFPKLQRVRWFEWPNPNEFVRKRAPSNFQIFFAHNQHLEKLFYSWVLENGYSPQCMNCHLMSTGIKVERIHYNFNKSV